MGTVNNYAIQRRLLHSLDTDIERLKQLSHGTMVLRKITAMHSKQELLKILPFRESECSPELTPLILNANGSLVTPVCTLFVSCGGIIQLKMAPRCRRIYR